jgi:hypothetical protein
MNLRVLTILFICCLNNLRAQDLYGKYLGTEQGLLSKECYDINFDKAGYLIVGTQYGPMKYDGEKFISICMNLPIERRIMYDFEKDPYGRIYLLNSKNEIFILKKDRAVRIAPKIPIPIAPSNHFKKINWFAKGLILFSDDAYYQYEFKNNTLSPCYKRSKQHKNIFVYNPAKDFPFEKRLSEFRTVPNHTIVFYLDQKRLYKVNEQISSESREDLTKVDKTYFAVINLNLYHIYTNKIEALPYKNILFMEYFHGRIWLATRDGLVELDKKGNLIQIHFRGQVIGGIAPISNKGIAVSLNQNGIFICSNIHERCYNNIMPSEVSNHKQTTIIGSKNGELFRFQKNKLVKIKNTVKPDIEDVNSASLKIIRRIEFIKNKWYICTLKGVYTLSADFKKTEKKMMNQYFSFSDFFISKGRIHAISWSGISTHYPDVDMVRMPLIRCKYQLNDSTIFLGSEEGLFDYHLDTRKLVRSTLFQQTLYISNIQALAPNEFLISSRYQGIFHFKNGHLVKKHASPCFSLKKAIISNGQLIAAGNQGIYIKQLKYVKKSWTKIFDKEIQNIFLFNRKLFICTDNTLITKELVSNSEIRKPAIILNEILLGNQKIRTLPKEISYNIPISFDFDILNFSANKLRLYYRLKGESRTCQYTEGTKISFEALPSGKYRLELFPVIDGKIQFDNSKQYQFKINQPFWESTLFYLLVSIVVLLLLLSIRLIRKLRRKKRATERAELESKLNEYKLLAVKAQVNPHFLSNGFAAIQALILKGDNDFAAHYLAKFSFLMRKILHYSETQFITVKQELELVDAYLELELLRLKYRFKIHRNIDLPETELHKFLVPSLLLQPILENAIWHGLKFRENNPELVISFELNQSRELIIQISDNGPGFNSLNKTEGHLSKGNKLITERIDTLNKQFQKQVAQMDVLTSVSGTNVIFTFTPDLYQPQ